MLRATVAIWFACSLLLLALSCGTGGSSRSQPPASVGGNGGGGGGGAGGGISGGGGSGPATIVSHAFAADSLSSASDIFGIRVDANGTAAQTPGSPFATPAPSISVAVSGTMLAVSSNDALGVGGASHVTMYKVDANGLPTLQRDNLVTDPGEITFSPDGKFLCLSFLGRTRGYAVNVSTGALTQVFGSPWQTGYNGASNPRVSPLGNTYCVASSTSNINHAVYCYARNVSTGVINSGSEFRATTEPNTITAFAISPDNNWVISVSSSNHLQAGELSASGSRISSEGTGSQPTGLAISHDGTMVVTANSGSNDVSVYRFDTSTGRLTLLGRPISLGTSANKAAFSSDGKYLYVTTSNTVVVFSVDSAGGSLSSLRGSPLNTGPAPSAVDAF